MSGRTADSIEGVAYYPPVAEENAMRPLIAGSLAVVALFASGCGAPEDPQLAMCQALAKQLTGDTVSDWADIEQREGSRARTVSIAFERSAGGAGSIDCRYPIDRQNGAVATAPDQVALDGERVPTGTLLGAGARASGEIIAGTAAETAARTKVLAEDAGERVRDAAEQVRDLAADGVKTLQESLER